MFKILSGTILCQQKWKHMPNYWVWAQILSKTNLSIVTILLDFSQLHVIFSHYTLFSTKETLFSMKYNVYCLRKYKNTCILHTKFFDQNVTPYLHLALCNFERGHHGEHSCEVILNLDQWLRRCCLKKKFMDARRTPDNDWSQYLTLSLWLRWA